MIPAGVQIFLSVQPMDLRAGFQRLSACVRDQLGLDPEGGALFVFVGRRKTSLKILFFDATGVCLYYKRLHRGTFRLPDPPEDGCTQLEVDETMLDALLDGIPLAPSAHPTRRHRTRLQ